jgi:radical SAM protein with 4Fe4S-binding SPASM domain
MIKNILGKLFQLFRSTTLGIKLKGIIPRTTILSLGYKLSIQKLIDYNYPATFNLEPTNLCNLSCQMCPRDKSQRKPGYLDMGLFKKIVDEAKEFGPRHFVLHKDGEPLLHKNIVDMVRYIKESHKGNTTYISTNGLLLTEDKALGLINVQLDQLHISVGAATPETYLKIRGGNLETVENNIKRFITLKGSLSSQKPILTLQIIKMTETSEEIQLFINKWRPYKANFSIPNFLTWGGAENNAIMKEQKPRKRYPCHSLWFAPSINWDGKVSICCIDWNNEEIIGDLSRQTLAKIWQSDKIKQYRQYHLSGNYDKIPLCRNCNYWRETPNFFFRWQYKK